MLVAFEDFTWFSKSKGSRPTLGTVIIAPPRLWVMKPPRNIPVPCIKGHAIRHLLKQFVLLISKIIGLSCSIFSLSLTSGTLWPWAFRPPNIDTTKLP